MEKRDKKGRLMKGNTNGFKKGQRPWNQIGEFPLSQAEREGRYRQAHPDRRRKSHETYRKANPDKVKKWKRDYALKRKNDPQYILATNLRRRILKVLGRKKEYGRASSIDFLGCSVNDLKFYLQGKFQDGMTWENHGQHGWHIDHIIPLAFFDLTNHDQVRQAFHYTNLQPLWATDNLKKWKHVIEKHG